MLKNALLMLTVGALMTVSAPAPLTTSASAAVVIQDAGDEDATEDMVIFTNGRVVRGDILEETDATIIMNVRIGSMPAVRTVYEKDQILEIKRDIPRESEGRKDEAEKKEEVLPDKNTRGEDIDEDTTLFYYAELDGVFEIDLTVTPLRRLFADADEAFDDLVPVQNASGGVDYRVDQSKRDKHIILLKIDTMTEDGRFGGLRDVELITPVIKEEIQKGRRIVFWVENALGGAAFLPWLSPDMYITPNSVMGFADDLDDMDFGDDQVTSKMISLQMGHAEGMAVYGGYGAFGVAIMQAMARGQYWLAVRLTGVEPEYYISTEKPGPEIMNNPQWIILSDDGKDDNEDDPDESLYGNDTLVLQDDLALKLGIADGVASSIEDIALSMRVFRNYAVLEQTKADSILDGWAEEIRRAIVNYQRAWDEANNVQIGGGRDAIIAALGRQIRLLRQARSILGRYAEVLDPDGTERANIDVWIEAIRARIRNFRNDGDGGPGGGGAGGGAGGR